jgi:hypothetical protein
MAVKGPNKNSLNKNKEFWCISCRHFEKYIVLTAIKISILLCCLTLHRSYLYKVFQTVSGCKSAVKVRNKVVAHGRIQSRIVSFDFLTHTITHLPHPLSA